MAQNEDSIKSQQKSPHSHLPCVSCADTSISSFDLLNSYRSSGNNQTVVSVAAAALLLQAAAGNESQRKSMNHPGVSPISNVSHKQRCISPPENDNPLSIAPPSGPPALVSRPCQHSPTTNSKIQAALALAMAASSPTSTCPSSSSSGHQGEHGSSDFRSEQQSSINALFRQPQQSSYETVDGGGNGSDLGFPPTNPTPMQSFVPFTTSSTGSPDMSASACLTNAMLLPASIVSALGQQMQGNQYHQSQSPAYLSTIGGNPGFANQQPGGHSQHPSAGMMGGGGGGGPQCVSGGDPSGGYQTPNPPGCLPQLTASPANTDAGRYSAPSRASSNALHDDGHNKREQRLLKNREAARECRRKKKEYVRCLERQVHILQNQNQQLIEELQKMKALCAGALLDPNIQPGAVAGSLPPPPSLQDRSGGGMDYVDSVGGSGGHHHLRSSNKSSRLTSPSSSSTNNSSSYRPTDLEVGESSSSRQASNELTLLKSPLPHTPQQLLLLQGLSALKGERHKREHEDSVGGDFSGGDRWKQDDEHDTRPPSSSPHIHPVKRALKRFGNEQRRLSQQAAAAAVGKTDPDKAAH